MVEPGAVLCGKYRIEQLLGKGGMGLVARARHLELGQPVAIKVLLAEVLKNEGMVKRFRREAQAMVQLKSEHVCRVFDIGVLDSGAPFMVMEYLEGKDLDVVLQEQGPLAPGFAVDLVLQACEALAEAHALGIVHRDIKPANCFLTHGPDGEPLLKVLDFGISKASGGGVAGVITTSLTLIGSPVYMSPEQMRCSKDVDARADIWGLGVVLYELLSGRPPFHGDNFAALCLAVTTMPMLPLDGARLPEGLAGVISRCLEKQPKDRFGSVAELSAALAPFAGTSAQGERSRARTARMLGRANALALAVMGPLAGARGDQLATIVGAGPGRQPNHRFMGALPTVAATPAPASTDQGKHTSELGPTESMAGPLRGVSRPRWRRLWPLAPIGLALFALIVVLVRGGDQPPVTAGPESEHVGQPDGGVLPATAVDVALVPATAGGTGERAPGDVEGEARGPDARLDDAGATHDLASEAGRRSRRRVDRGGGERSSASGRPVSPREAPAPSRTNDAKRQRPRATAVESLLDDAAFGSRE